MNGISELLNGFEAAQEHVMRAKMEARDLKMKLVQAVVENGMLDVLSVDTRKLRNWIHRTR